MGNEHFYKDPSLAFAEFRHSRNSGRHFKAHMHKTFSVGAIDHGSVIYQVEGQSAILRPGSLALINPEKLHSCNPAESCRRSYYMLHLDVDWCLKLQQSLWELQYFSPVNAILLEDGAVYRKYIHTMNLFMNGGELLEKEQKLAELVEAIFVQVCQPATKRNSPSQQIEQLKLQLSMDLQRDLSMQQLSTTVGANPYTLLRHFKAATGLTPHAYRLNCKIERARKLLQKGVELSQVALDCGFFDQSHFHRHFKAQTTVTPREYQINFMQ